MTTSESPPVDRSSFLDAHAIDEALTFLADNWPNKPMNAGQRDAWTDVLVQLHRGELRAVLAKTATRYRPDPYEFLERVLEFRQPSAEKRYNTPDTAAVRKLAHEERDPSKFDPREIPSIVHARTMLGKAPDAFKARVEEHKAKKESANVRS